jgi:hypothetical protein
MDPLSALGLAGNVVAFVQFSASLVKGTYKIYRSPTGQSEELQDLEGIYSKLADFSKTLGKPQGSYVEDPENETAQAGSLSQLAEMCRSDCEQLLGMVEKLKVKSGSRAKSWRSFTKAMGEVWRSNDIVKLQKRIASCEQAMVVQLCLTSR